MFIWLRLKATFTVFLDVLEAKISCDILDFVFPVVFEFP
jgi:hypothetical protein